MQNKLASLLSLINELRAFPLTVQGCSSAASILEKMENEIKSIECDSFSIPPKGKRGDYKYGCMAVNATDYRAVIKSDSIIAITETKGANKSNTSILMNSGNWLEVDVSYEEVISKHLGYLRECAGR
ncbi:hypothetical protein ORL23_00600 [Kluyvera cryocrescens]|uniref:hypothetical protein n=1 Tax=Kluyvera cryocrescens TaxID=580 RepID=UPI00224AF248|nr:hypothetical protein [Kluyvera cryocrescens]MCX2865989.1 hypothetical protein [Kluyvera cryocrescens]